jgi:hypothetical protein
MGGAFPIIRLRARVRRDWAAGGKKMTDLIADAGSAECGG